MYESLHGKRFYSWASAVIVACITLQGGCTSLHLAKQQVLVEGARYNAELEMKRLEKATLRAADAALDVLCDKSTCPISPDYKKGFRAGYADYLRFGGNCSPPPMPPHEYWGNKYQTACGRIAVEQWYGGFRAGSSMAKQSGLRGTITIPAKVLGYCGPCQPCQQYPTVFVNCQGSCSECDGPTASVPNPVVSGSNAIQVANGQALSGAQPIMAAAHHQRPVVTGALPSARFTSFTPADNQDAPVHKEYTNRPRGSFTSFRPYVSGQRKSSPASDNSAPQE